MQPPSELQQLLAATVPGAELAPTVVSQDQQLQLWLLSPDYPRGPLPPDVAAAIVARPAYWAFCWASGRVLADHLLANPDLVRGRRVLDFGAGSGVAGIAAAMAGAAAVVACDLDPDALLASAANARLNRVNISTCTDLAQLDPSDWDLVLMADVLYDRANMPLLEAVQRRFPQVLLADSRVPPKDLPNWQLQASTNSDTLPDLDESSLFRTVRLYKPNLDCPNWDCTNRGCPKRDCP